MEETIRTNCLWAIAGILLEVIILIIIIFITRRRRSKRELQKFLCSLSQSFDHAWKIHGKTTTITKNGLAEIINGEIESEMKYALKGLFSRVNHFPAKSFKFFSTEYGETNRFIGKMFPRMQILYQDYKDAKGKIHDDRVHKQFFNDSQACILEVVESVKKEKCLQ